MSKFIQENPFFGYVLSGSGGLAALLSFFKVVTPFLGFLGALLGFVAGFITLRIKLAEWNEWKKDHPESKKYHKYDDFDLGDN